MRNSTRFFPLFLASVVIFSPSAKAIGNSEINLWQTAPVRIAFEFGNGSYTHIDAAKKIKWYVWDLQKKYYLSQKMPFAIRPAKEVRILDVNSKCTSVPIVITRELSQAEASDQQNQTVIQFFQPKIGLDRSSTLAQITSRQVIFSLGPSNWSSISNTQMEVQIPICEDMLGARISTLVNNEISLPFRYVYSTKHDSSLDNFDPKCSEVVSGKCFFYNKPVNIYGIKFSQSNPEFDTVKEFYQEQIDKEKDYLKSRPCEIPYSSYDQQSNSNILIKDNEAICESSQMNLDFLTSQILLHSKSLLAKVSPSPSVSHAPTPKPLTSVSPTPTATFVANSSQESSAKSKITIEKRTSIICAKGKVTKKVTGINPKCPTGYKKK